MKQIIAVVRPHLADRVLEAIKRAPLEAMTVSEVKGYGRQKSYLDEYKETEFSEAFLPKVQIILWVDEPRYEETLDKVVTAARSGRIGDGKVFTLPIDAFQ
ncbi:MAG: P-II family nitrogen regulator [Planctomycetota bacterium]